MQDNASDVFALLSKAKSGDDAAKSELHAFLLAKAKEAAQRSYSPYSKFPVGAALLTSEGAVIFGCNVENASYGAAICAERTAIVKAISDGHTNFEMIAVACIRIKDGWPCGICRQFICEFGPHIEIIGENESGNVQVFTIAEMLPKLFGPESLGL